MYLARHLGEGESLFLLKGEGDLRLRGGGEMES